MSLKKGLIRVGLTLWALKSVVTIPLFISYLADQSAPSGSSGIAKASIQASSPWPSGGASTAFNSISPAALISRRLTIEIAGNPFSRPRVTG